MQKLISIVSFPPVFEILLEYCTSKDWEKAFCTIIPQRKLVTPINADSKIDSESKDSKLEDGDVTRTDNNF